ncbi:hypothetical protein [Shewanella sp. OMA3-2]|nr:hypothetical protein [Shewanella sp. OMA3-2]UJF22576.1 hypothetical protein L0B17_03980 [Shewanella sp. OMA3-2]
MWQQIWRSTVGILLRLSTSTSAADDINSKQVADADDIDTDTVGVKS